ncbi:MAG: hypothetical protein ABI765_06050 [Gemmatimonadota bacterium]
MYHTCIFCYTDLGTNPLIEACPIGQRLAFDPKRGRLWVVCRKCERWNLTPIEERWEALEDCERRFRGTRLRYSTDNIGLARLAPGLDLVRIGSPLRPEMAAWRYGDQFGRRRQRHLIVGGATVAGAAAAYFAAAPVLAALGISGSLAYNALIVGRGVLHNSRSAVTVPQSDAPTLKLSASQLEAVELLPETGSGWALLIPGRRNKKSEALTLSGQPAVDALQRILPWLNRGGGSRTTVDRAVTRLEETPDLDSQLHRMADAPVVSWWKGGGSALQRQPAASRLALEMLLREGLEERSMKGELWLLEREWKAAEQVAAIADDLLLPDDIRERIDAESRKQR